MFFEIYTGMETIIIKFGLLISVCMFILIFCLCSFCSGRGERTISVEGEENLRREIVENYVRVREQRQYINSILSHYLNERNNMPSTQKSRDESIGESVDEIIDEIIDSDDVIIIVGPCGKKNLGTKIEKS